MADLVAKIKWVIFFQSLFRKFGETFSLKCLNQIFPWRYFPVWTRLKQRCSKKTRKSSVTLLHDIDWTFRWSEFFRDRITIATHCRHCHFYISLFSWNLNLHFQYLFIIKLNLGVLILKNLWQCFRERFRWSFWSLKWNEWKRILSGCSNLHLPGLSKIYFDILWPRMVQIIVRNPYFTCVR